MVVRVAMWSGPRNVSTALMRSFGSRGDTLVVDEPLYAHYLDVTGLDPRTAPQLFEFDWHRGSPLTFQTLGPNDAVIDRKFGEDNNIDVGDKLRVTTPTGKHVVYTVRGSINDNADFVGDYVIPLRTIERDFDQRKDLLVLVDLQPAASVPVVRADIKRLLDESWANDLDAQLDLERETQREASLTPDYAEGMRAFFEKRSPVFSGRRS